MAQKHALITGITGQDGSYLAEFLLSKKYKVFGLTRRTSTPKYERIKHIEDQIELIPGDLLDQQSVTSAVSYSKPDEIYNLAAQSFVATSWSQPVLTGEFTALGVTRVLEAVRQVKPDAKFYQASSSEMFGKVRQSPQNEDTPFHPRSPHGVAKIYLKLADHLVLGNLDAKRDWGFAGDYVKAMWMMLQQERPDDFVVATGENHSVAEFVEEAFKVIGIANWKKYVKISKDFFRPAEVDFLVGDASRARKILGWKPTVNFSQLVEMMVQADIELLKKNSS